MALLLAAVAAGGSGVASAAWTSGTSGGASVESLAMPLVGAPSVAVQGRNTTLTWTTARFANAASTPVAGYVVRRYDAASGVAASVGPACAGTLTGLTCTERGLPAGSWRYVVVSRLAGWTGAEGTGSTVVVGAPSLALGATSLDNAGFASSSSTTAAVTNFLDGEAVQFRLGSASGPIVGSGTAGTGGAASGTITVSAGTAPGETSVVAVGGSGSTATAALTVTAAARTLVVTPSTSSPSAGGAITVTVQARISGQNDTTVAGARTISVTGLAAAPDGTAATVPTQATFDADGLATITVTPRLAGAATLAISVPSLGHTGSATLDVKLGAVTRLAYTSSGASCSTGTVTIARGGTWTSRITAFDALGNSANPSAAVTVSLATSSGQGSISATSLQVAAGASPSETSAAVTATLQNGSNRLYTVRATVGGVGVSCEVRSN